MSVSRELGTKKRIARAMKDVVLQLRVRCVDGSLLSLKVYLF